MVGWCSMGTFNDPCLQTTSMFLKGQTLVSTVFPSLNLAWKSSIFYCFSRAYPRDEIFVFPMVFFYLDGLEIGQPFGHLGILGFQWTWKHHLAHGAHPHSVSAHFQTDCFNFRAPSEPHEPCYMSEWRVPFGTLIKPGLPFALMMVLFKQFKPIYRRFPC